MTVLYAFKFGRFALFNVISIVSNTVLSIRSTIAILGIFFVCVQANFRRVLFLFFSIFLLHLFEFF